MPSFIDDGGGDEDEEPPSENDGCGNEEEEEEEEEFKSPLADEDDEVDRISTPSAPHSAAQPKTSRKESARRPLLLNCWEAVARFVVAAEEPSKFAALFRMGISNSSSESMNVCDDANFVDFSSAEGVAAEDFAELT